MISLSFSLGLVPIKLFFFFFFKNVPIKDATRSCGQLHKVYEAEPALDGPLKMLFLKLFIQKYDVLNFLTYG